MPTNGRYPASVLAPIPGGRLRKDAAAAWNAMLAEARRRGLPEPTPDGADSSYRSFDRQVYWKDYWCGQGHCENAATPGSSHHGEGIAVDCSVDNNNGTIAQIGEKFGWSRKWSDAPWEPWHHTYKEGIWSPPKGPTILQYGDKGWRVIGMTSRLRRCGWLRLPSWKFNRKVHGAVVAFQGKHKLSPDGKVGPQTDAVLLRSAEWCKKHHEHEV